MCRILLAKSKEKVSPVNILEEFADMCKTSKAPDGDWQGDGFGASWLDENNEWQTIKHTDPIWEKQELFNDVPRCRFFCAHARSATFKSKMAEGDTSYNQPYTNKDYSYVFNGRLRGVKVKRKVPGKIGAEKIWNLALEFLEDSPPKGSLEKINDYMGANTKEILAMNIGLSDKKHLYALCRYKPNDIKPDYHNLFFLDSPDIKMIASQPLKSFDMKKMDNDSILKL